jgi:hypothetical protein
MIADRARPPRDVEGAAKQRLVVSSQICGHSPLQLIDSIEGYLADSRGGAQSDSSILEQQRQL